MEADSITWLSPSGDTPVGDRAYMLIYDSSDIRRSYFLKPDRRDDYWKNVGIILLMK